MLLSGTLSTAVHDSPTPGALKPRVALAAYIAESAAKVANRAREDLGQGHRHGERETCTGSGYQDGFIDGVLLK